MFWASAVTVVILTYCLHFQPITSAGEFERHQKGRSYAPLSQMPGYAQCRRNMLCSSGERRQSNLRLKTHGVENRRRFSTPKTDMVEKSDDDAVAAAIVHSYSCKS